MDCSEKVLRPQLWQLARLLEYPFDGFAPEAAELCAQLCLHCPAEAAEALDMFAVEILQTPADDLEEMHTRTFSLAPVCAPYVGLQVFGENNYKRGDFIACLSRDLQSYGIDVHPELPDHVGSMLRLAACQPPEELQEMLTWCFCGAVEKMTETLATTASPYKHLFTAVSLILNDHKTGVTANA